MMAADDLWGEIPNRDTAKSPLVIVKEQAALLEAKTNGELRGVAHARRVDGGGIKVRLGIEAPSADNYYYGLLEFECDPVEVYPLQIFDLTADFGYHVENVQEFKARLSAVFGSPKVKRVISRLRAVSTEEWPKEDEVPF